MTTSPPTYDPDKFAQWQRAQAKKDDAWIHFLPRTDQETLIRRYKGIEAAIGRALKEAERESLRKAHCRNRKEGLTLKTCGARPATLDDVICRVCGKPLSPTPGSIYEKMEKTLQKKFLHDLNSLLDAYRSRLPKVMGGKHSLTENVKKPKEWASKKWRRWADRHQTAASRLETTYKVGKVVKEGGEYVSSGISIAKGVTTGTVALWGPTAATILGSSVVAAATGPGGIAIIAYHCFGFVNKMGGRLWYAIEASKRWDAETGSLTTRAGKAIWENADLMRRYLQSRDKGLDYVAWLENIFLDRYGKVREQYMHWDAHRRELLGEVQVLGAEFAKCERLMKGIDDWVQAAKQDPTMKSKDFRAAKRLMKDTRKQADEGFKEVKKLLKDLMKRGSTTLNDLNEKMAKLHNHSSDWPKEQKQRWYKDEQGEYRKGKGIQIATKDQIESRLAVPSNERWIGEAPKGKIDELSEKQHHELQRGFAEWIMRKHRWWAKS